MAFTRSITSASPSRTWSARASSTVPARRGADAPALVGQRRLRVGNVGYPRGDRRGVLPRCPAARSSSCSSTAARPGQWTWGRTTSATRTCAWRPTTSSPSSTACAGAHVHDEEPIPVPAARSSAGSSATSATPTTSRSSSSAVRPGAGHDAGEAYASAIRQAATSRTRSGSGLADKVAFVTGAARGQGRAIARRSRRGRRPRRVRRLRAAARHAVPGLHRRRARRDAPDRRVARPALHQREVLDVRDHAALEALAAPGRRGARRRSTSSARTPGSPRGSAPRDHRGPVVGDDRRQPRRRVLDRRAVAPSMIERGRAASSSPRR